MIALFIIACMCGGPRTIEGGMRTSDAVFNATILSKRVTVEREVSGYEPLIVATAHVDRIWKGDPARVVRIRTGIGGGDCGIHLDRGKVYRVFAHGSDDTYGTGVCDMTHRENAPPRVPPNNPWSQRFLNLWSACVVMWYWWRWPIVLAISAALVLRERVVVPFATWLISWGVLVYDRSWLDLSVVLWSLLGGIVAAILYLAWRLLPMRKMRILAPVLMPAAILMIEWPPSLEGYFYGKFSVARFFLGAWSMPSTSHLLTFLIPLLLLTLLWIATLSRRWYASVPAALVLALLAIRASGPWPGLLNALQ